MWKVDDSTIWHWFGYWLGVFFIAYLTCIQLGYLFSLALGMLGSLVFWAIKEIVWDKLIRKTEINLADIFAGFLFSYVFSRIWKTQRKN